MNSYHRLLRHLYIYRYLTVSQITSIGRKHSKKSLYDHLSVLKQKGFIRKYTYKFHPELGRLEDMHFLQPKGLDYLNRMGEHDYPNIFLSKKKEGFYQDYQHRKMTIDCHIQLRNLESNQDVKFTFWDNYFEQKKGPESRYRETSTKIHLVNSYLIPDAIFGVNIEGVDKLFCLELHRGHRILKIEKQLRQYAFALANGAVSLNYGCESNANVLTVFEKESALHTSLERLSQDLFYTHLKPYYLFTSYMDLIADPASKRINLKQKAQALFAN